MHQIRKALCCLPPSSSCVRIIVWWVFYFSLLIRRLFPRQRGMLVWGMGYPTVAGWPSNSPFLSHIWFGISDSVNPIFIMKHCQISSIHLLILYDLPGSTMFLMCLYIVFLGDPFVSVNQDWVRITKGKNSLVIFRFASADFFPL